MDVNSESEHHSNIDCEWMDMNSDSGDSFNIDYQVLGIVEVGTLDLPYSQLAITSGTTYDDLNTQLKQLKPNHDLAVTVPYFGPYPFFRYPFPSETISSSAREVYVIDRNECNTLVVVRTGDEDIVVPLALSAEEGRLLTIDVITAHIGVHGYSPISVKDYTGQLDIGLQSLETIKSSSKKAYPTIAFVETRSEGYDFHTQLKEDIPVTESLNFLLARGEALVHRISHIESDDLRPVHLARAMIHLIVSSQEVMSTDNDLAIVDYCKDLHRIFDKLEECTEMINDSEETALSIFHELCENRPGAVAIRHSYDEFLKLNPRNSVPRDRVHSNTAQSTTSANQSVTRHHDDTRRSPDTELSDNLTIEPVLSSPLLPGSPTGPIPSFQTVNESTTGTGAVESAIWTFRPAPELVLGDIATYFPDYEVEKLITDLDSNASSPSDGKSPTAADLPYSALSPGPPAQPTRSPSMVLSAMDGPRLTLRPPPVGGNSRKLDLRLNIPAGASPFGGIGAYKLDVIDPVDDLVSTTAKRGKNTSRLSQDDATSGTVVGRRSTKFWGTSMKERRPSDMRKPVNAEPLSLLPNLPVTQWAKGILIGKGTYGKVYFGFNMTAVEVIAVKRVEMPEASSEYQGSRQKQVLRAIKAKSATLCELDHPNIVAYLGFEQTDKYFSIFLEYVPGRSIGECYRKLGHGFDQNLTRHCTRQILNGLAYIHSRGILHRDLKADNIFLDLEGNCKISDFGISKHEHDNVYGTNEAMTAMQGTVFWMAPEILVTQDGDSGQADIWSFGCVVLEMCTGDTPWAPKSSVAVILLLGNSDTRQAPPMADDLNISLEGRDMLNQCFQLEPSARPTAEALKAHPYLEEGEPNWRFEAGAIEYRAKTPQIAFPYTLESQRSLDYGASPPGINLQPLQNDQTYRSGVSSPNAFSSPLWSPNTRPGSQRTTLVSPGATTSPQITPNSRISPKRSVTSTVNSKLRSSYGSGGVEKSQSILERMERFVTTHKTMQEKAAFKYQDMYLTRTNGRKPDKEPEAEAWSEDGPSSSSDSEEDNHQSSFYDSRSHSSGPRVDHGYSSQGLQQATHGFSQLQIPACEHPLSTPNPTEPLIEAEYESEEEDELPDLSGTVKLLSRYPIFSGTYSSVYEGVWEDRHVAVKVIRAVGSLKATRRKYRREAQVWSRLSHPNILPLYGLCMDSDFDPFGALISPWCKNGNSAESVHEIRSPADRIRLLLGVANGIRYLHEHVNRLVHGDLKPANILIDDDRVARLCDFGLVRLIQETPSGMTTTTAHTGTVRYLAQELVISDDPKPTTETDCHALGCIALEFAYLHPPYAHRGSTAPAGQFYMDISRGVPPSHRPELVASLDLGHSLLWNLLEACWDPEPQRRPSSTRIYNYLIENETVIVAALNSCIDIF